MIMKRLLVLIPLILAVSLAASAQTGLNIDKIFGGKYVSDPKVTETLMSGNHWYLRDHDLSILATFKGPASVYAPIIEPLILSDARKALGRNVRYQEGKLYFAFLILPPLQSRGSKVNRYLYYLNTINRGGTNVVVVYLEGSLSQDEASDLISAMTRNSK